MSWLLWLSGPVIAGGATAVWAWWVERPERRPGTRGAVRAHGRYLTALDEALDETYDRVRPNA